MASHASACSCLLAGGARSILPPGFTVARLPRITQISHTRKAILPIAPASSRPPGFAKYSGLPREPPETARARPIPPIGAERDEPSVFVRPAGRPRDLEMRGPHDLRMGEQARQEGPRRHVQRPGLPGVPPPNLAAKPPCSYPGCTKTADTLDHIRPVSLGGGNKPSNLRPMCRAHNEVLGRDLGNRMK